MNKIIEIAQAEIGYQEQEDNQTKYGKWFGLDSVPWCAIFVSWCYHMAGLPLGNLGFTKGFAGCQTGYRLFKEKGWIVSDPQPGDIVLFDWNGDGRFDHAGIYESHYDFKRIYTIEGNTSMKNNSNGGTVMRRIRNTDKCIFIHPDVKPVTETST